MVFQIQLFSLNPAILIRYNIYQYLNNYVQKNILLNYFKILIKQLGL